jgi:hypothetical protein
MKRLQHLLDRGLIGYGLLTPDSKRKDGGSGRLRGAVNHNMLADPAHVSPGSRVRASGMPSKGGTVYGRPWEPVPDQHLNEPKLQTQRYPGDKLQKRNRKRVGVRGGIIGSGPPYGSRGRSKTSY